MSSYILSSLASITPLKDGNFLLSNGANIEHNVNQDVIDVLALFQQPQSFEAVAELHGNSPDIITFLQALEQDLILVATDIDHQQSMRMTWNCLSAVSAEDAAFFIDNETNTLEEFEQAGNEGVEALLDLLPIESHWLAANIGCGMGRIDKPLSPHLKELWCLDVSDIMIERASHYLANCNNINLVRTEGMLQTINNNSLDLVISFLVFQHIPKDSTWQYFDEASRALKPGGHFLFQILCYNSTQGFDPSEHSPISRYYGPGKARYSEQEVTHQLAEAGFEIKLIKDGDYKGKERRLSGIPSEHWSSKIIHCIKQ